MWPSLMMPSWRVPHLRRGPWKDKPGHPSPWRPRWPPQRGPLKSWPLLRFLPKSQPPLVFVHDCSAIDIMPELKKNILNFGYGVNFKYEGMLSHSFDRFYIVTKFELPKTQDLNLATFGFDFECSYANHFLDHLLGYYLCLNTCWMSLELLKTK